MKKVNEKSTDKEHLANKRKKHRLMKCVAIAGIAIIGIYIIFSILVMSKRDWNGTSVILSSDEKAPVWLKLITPFLRLQRFSELSGEPESDKWYRIYPEGIVSANGEDAYADFKLGKENKLVIYFAGGGVSWDEYTASRPSSLYSKEMTETYYAAHVDLFTDMNVSSGLMEDSNRSVTNDWTKVVINYTTGDFHIGTNDYHYIDQEGNEKILHHNGYTNYRAILEEIKKYIPDPDELLIAGGSAGGFGAALLADDIIGEFPDAENITLLVDSGFSLKDDWPEVAKNIWNAPVSITDNLVSDNITLDAMKALYSKYGDQINYLFCISPRDETLSMMKNAVLYGEQKYSIEMGKAFQNDVKEMIDELKEVMPNVGIFIFDLQSDSHKDMNLTAHCIIGGNDFYDYKVDGKTAYQWVHDGMRGKTEKIGLSLVQ